MSVRSTRHHTLLHNSTILHTNTFFVLACHPRKIYRYMAARSTRHYTLLHKIMHLKTFFAPACHPRKKTLPTSKYDSNTHLSRKFLLFFFRVRVRVTVTVQSATHPQLVYITTREYTSWLLFHSYFIRKDYHTHEYREVLDNTSLVEER